MILAQIALPPKATDGFVIASVLLGILGTLFLAYDLLGRENGPLRWFTLVIICGLVSALLLATTGTITAAIIHKLANNPFNLNFTVPFLVLGGFMGFFTVILVELPASKSKPPIFSRKGSLIGVAFGLTFGFVIKFILLGPLEAALAIGGSCAVIASIWQHITWEPAQAASNPRGVWRFVAWEEPSPSNPNPRGTWKFVDWEPPHPKPHLFSRQRFLLGLVSGFVCWFVVFFTASKNVIASLLQSVPLALICGVIISTWRFINWEPPHPRPRLFSRKGFWTGFVAGFVPWLIFEIWQDYPGLQRVSGPVAGFEAMLTLSVTLLTVGHLRWRLRLQGALRSTPCGEQTGCPTVYWEPLDCSSS